MQLGTVLLAAVLATALAVEETCVGRCDGGFDAKKKCQCDSMCKYYQSCCIDYDTVCRPKVVRGDVFQVPEDEYDDYSNDTVSAKPEESGGLLNPNTIKPAPTAMHMESKPETKPPPTDPSPPGPGSETCSGKPFDAFMQLKNGSIFAFRGEHFYELDEKEVRPGYPKLIKDVWGIEGPIDAAFTRINCQGKSYIFKGSKYWRFDDGFLDPDYPREISVGFANIPEDVDGAFALPAANYYSREKVYFFKGDQYYQYEFRQQPSQEECSRMAPSTLFTRYTALKIDSFEDLFSFLFHNSPRPGQSSSSGPRSLEKDWGGIPGPIDAVMAGRLYVTPRGPEAQSKTLSKWRSNGKYKRGRQRQRQKQRQRQRQKQRGRFSRSPFWDIVDQFWLPDYGQNEETGQDQTRQRGRGQQEPDNYNYDLDPLDFTYDALSKCQPVQSIYFFIKDQYYRVNLQTKRIDSVTPPYPRSIAKYWLGCPETDLAEKK
uniref:Vitronectin b n=1 Tax=Lepisosteus oculatus TaxID=7918 RepID=W5MDU0_LEPOC|nr:PREDICTED: vitronectin [Lepisosteus oculatus]